jgi:magnesium-transporting ATPase (P-type)
LILGDIQEGLMLLSFVFAVMSIEFCQEKKTEKALEALRDLASPRAIVIRDGDTIRIPGKEVVKGEVTAIALEAEIGKIGKPPESVKEGPVKLKRDMSKLVKTMAIVGIILCILVKLSLICVISIRRKQAFMKML